mmetsp:Transcript_95159/g.252746  ORF Transcript_95159/g.252746 Transcript_95159/m.252746 type:complete len:206 (+) Transcript_95159:407-1024(+)
MGRDAPDEDRGSARRARLRAQGRGGDEGAVADFRGEDQHEGPQNQRRHDQGGGTAGDPRGEPLHDRLLRLLLLVQQGGVVLHLGCVQQELHAKEPEDQDGGIVVERQAAGDIRHRVEDLAQAHGEEGHHRQCSDGAEEGQDPRILTPAVVATAASCQDGGDEEGLVSDLADKGEQERLHDGVGGVDGLIRCRLGHGLGRRGVADR